MHILTGSRHFFGEKQVDMVKGLEIKCKGVVMKCLFFNHDAEFVISGSLNI